MRDSEVAGLVEIGYNTGMNSCKDLDIWKLAREAALQIHRMTLAKPPNFEIYESGSQIRRAAKSILSNIVERYVALKGISEDGPKPFRFHRPQCHRCYRRLERGYDMIPQVPELPVRRRDNRMS